MPSGGPQTLNVSVWKRLLLFALGAAACVLGYLWLLGLSSLGPASPTAGVIPALVMALATFALNGRFLRADGRSLADIGCTFSRRRAAQFGYGFLGGALLTGAWVGIVAAAAGARWHWNPSFRAPALVLAGTFAFFNNAGEELVYRGYAFVRLADRFGPAVAIVSTSLVFAILHLQAGIPWLNVAAGVLTSGLIFAILFARWRSLPLALGFHFATNLFQEASGLRPSSASPIVPTFPAAADSISMRTALAGVAVLNVLVASLLVRSWRRAMEPSNAASHGDASGFGRGR